MTPHAPAFDCVVSAAASADATAAHSFLAEAAGVDCAPLVSRQNASSAAFTSRRGPIRGKPMVALATTDAARMVSELREAIIFVSMFRYSLDSRPLITFAATSRAALSSPHASLCAPQFRI